MRWAAVALALAIVACGDAREDKPRGSVENFERYMKRQKLAEAQAHLTAIRHHADAYRTEMGHYLAGQTPPTPATGCCGKPKDECAADPSMWTGLWKELGFAIESPFRFQYSYDSDGKTYTAVAQSEVDCDGHVVHFKLTSDGRIEGPY